MPCGPEVRNSVHDDAKLDGRTPTRGAGVGQDRRARYQDRSVVVLGAIMSILDVTVVSVALPTFAGDVRDQLRGGRLDDDAYTLALATVIP